MELFGVFLLCVCVLSCLPSLPEKLGGYFLNLGSHDNKNAQLPRSSLTSWPPTAASVMNAFYSEASESGSCVQLTETSVAEPPLPPPLVSG